MVETTNVEEEESIIMKWWNNKDIVFSLIITLTFVGITLMIIGMGGGVRYTTDVTMQPYSSYMPWLNILSVVMPLSMMIIWFNNHRNFTDSCMSGFVVLDALNFIILGLALVTYINAFIHCDSIITIGAYQQFKYPYCPNRDSFQTNIPDPSFIAMMGGIVINFIASLIWFQQHYLNFVYHESAITVKEE